MYKYDQYDHAMVQARVEEFRDQTRRRIAGQLTDDQFKPLRLKNGLYLQLHAYMLRVAVPYGTLNSTQMRKLAHIARTYDRGYGHFTTRQNIQYNWIKLEEAPDILAELAEVDPQHQRRPVRRRRGRRDHRPAPVGRDDPADDHVHARVQLPAAQVQDLRDRQ
jgi:sulfite reductase beta subunit-like hemoprotein